MNIYEQAVAKFGADHQILKAVEELNELATALMHFRDGKIEPNVVESEIADVEIVCKTLRILIGNDIVDDKIRVKILRLEERLEDETTKDKTK